MTYMMNIKRAASLIAAVVIIALILITFFGGCQETSPKIDPHAHITAENVLSTCKEPAEFYPISRFGFPIEALVARHQNCLGIDDMFIVMWPGENNEKHRTAVKLLLLMYVEFQNTNDTTVAMTSDFIKFDQIESGEKKSHIAIYSLKKEQKQNKSPAGSRL